jgi:hypothetical protein
MPERVTLWVDGRELPCPAADGLEVVQNLLWSDDTKRTASGKFVGTKKGAKRTLKVRWATMPAETGAIIVAMARDTGKPLVDVSYTDLGEQVDMRAYFASPSYTMHRAGLVLNFAVELIEE